MNGAVAAPSPQAPAAGGMTPGLAAMLGGQAPPATAMSDQTPDIRKNPTHEWYVSLQVVRTSCVRALTKADEQDPSVKDFLTAVRGVCDKLLTGTMPKASILTSLARAIERYAPQISGQLDMLAYTLSQPQIGPGGMGAPGAPAGATPGALPNPLQGPPQGGPMQAGPGGPPTPQPGPGMG